MKALDIKTELIGSRKQPISYVTGELKELIEACLSLKWEHIKEELQDVMFAIQVLFACRTGLNIPIVLCKDSIEKFRLRRKAWIAAFAQYGMVFDILYLQHGSNYHKPEKVLLAFELAGKQLSKEESEILSRGDAGAITRVFMVYEDVAHLLHVY